MSFVRVEQRSAHLATSVRLSTVAGRNGPVAKATFTAISNAWRGTGETREEEATAILWTVWGRQAENAAQYLSKGSHVNLSGRVQNNNYDKDGTTVYGMAFTAEQVDYLDSKATSDALRERQEGRSQRADSGAMSGVPAAVKADEKGENGQGGSTGRKAGAGKSRRTRSADASGVEEDIAF